MQCRNLSRNLLLKVRGIKGGYEPWSGIVTDDQAFRNFNFFVENAKVGIHASESSLAFARSGSPPNRPVEKKGEKAAILFLINADLIAPRVIC
jgi:hypothetical protein